MAGEILTRETEKFFGRPVAPRSEGRMLRSRQSAIDLQVAINPVRSLGTPVAERQGYIVHSSRAAASPAAPASSVLQRPSR